MVSLLPPPTPIRDGGGGTNRCCTVEDNHHHCCCHHWMKTLLLTMPLRYRPSIPRQPPLTTTAVDEDHHCRSRHQSLLLSTMTAFASPLPSLSIAFAISVAVGIALTAKAIAKNKEESKTLNDSYNRALRKPQLSKYVIIWQSGFLKVRYC